MPELPEVETIRRDLQQEISGDTLIGAEFFGSRSAYSGDANAFIRQIAGSSIREIQRRGKYLLLALSNGEYIVVHLRMTGRLIIRQSDEPNDRLVRLVLRLASGRDLRLEDLRKFATVELLTVGGLAALFDRLGPEPLSSELTPERLGEILSHSRRGLKASLLDQSLLAGLGNIYVDEALFHARIHPDRPASGLSTAELKRLHQAIRHVLQAGIDTRGTTFSDYRDGLGRPGTHQYQLQVYRRTGEPCPTCGEPIIKTRVAGRGTHVCPRCQKL
ncbi:MAG: bifunctional DNA-formamidopyrimidine glycosylase/DNA-(apurinic or apyrimidinic site) lyase [Chloroflexi bacterium]|nr:bifunctional DNA-formamidopyrimidine glycosylase/DNA-(apurinic or apyrimidinic site) lyase [Chloroflexota bacterium]